MQVRLESNDADVSIIPCFRKTLVVVTVWVSLGKLRLFSNHHEYNQYLAKSSYQCEPTRMGGILFIQQYERKMKS